MSRNDDTLHTLVVGLDACCLPVLRPLFERGAVPAIESMIADNPSAPLESQVPPWSASAWPSLYTGKNPGKHGVFDFVAFEGYDWSVVDATHVRARPIWELLSEHGVTSVVVNVPVTHPPGEFDGALIPGMTAPEDPPCYPDGVLGDVEAACGDYRVYPRSGPEEAASLAAYERAIECRGDAFRYLTRRFEPGFGFLQFQVTDSVFHERPGDERAVEAVYRAVDEQLRAVVDSFDPTNVLLVSDHGMGEVTGHEFRANEFLRDRGYLTSTREGEGMPSWTRTWQTDLLDGDSGDGTASPAVRALERATGAAARVGLTTQRVASALDTLGLASVVGRYVPDSVQGAGSERVDFPASEAHVRSKSELGVRINLAGRDAAGVVPADEYERVRDDLIALLSAVETPSGDPLFESVEPRETYFEGPHIDRGPDILTVPADFDNALVAGLDGTTFADPWEPWNHTRDGVVALSGPDVADESLGHPHLYDIAPTICSLFDVPADVGMDGDPLPVVDATDQRSYDPYEPTRTATAADDTVQDRLTDLGYL